MSPASSTRAAVLGVLLIASLLVPARAQAHQFRPTVLRFDVATSGAHSVVWKRDGLDPQGIHGDELRFEGACEVEATDIGADTEVATSSED